MIRSKFGQRILGFFLFVLGCADIVWAWSRVMTEDYYYPYEAALFPAIAVCGLGMVFLPFDFERLREEHGVDRPRQLAHYPPEWKVLFFAALAAGLANWFLIAQA